MSQYLDISDGLAIWLKISINCESFAVREPHNAHLWHRQFKALAVTKRTRLVLHTGLVSLVWSGCNCRASAVVAPHQVQFRTHHTLRVRTSNDSISLDSMPFGPIQYPEPVIPKHTALLALGD